MKQKKGAIELSITTIIIIVIGITLLILGLGLVSNIFKQTGDISTKVFGQANTMVDKLLIESRFSIPSQVTIERGTSTTINAQVGHDGTVVQGPAKFDLILTPNFPAGITERQVMAKVISKSITINEGEQATFVIQLVASSTAPITTGFNAPAYSITVLANGREYETSAFIINVKKSKGLFGTF